MLTAADTDMLAWTKAVHIGAISSGLYFLVQVWGRAGDQNWMALLPIVILVVCGVVEAFLPLGKVPISESAQRAVAVVVEGCLGGLAISLTMAVSLAM